MAFLADVHYAWRALRSRPGFSAVALLTFALGIGANTTIFGVVNAVLLKPPDLRNSSELVVLWANNPSRNGTVDWSPSNADLIDWRHDNHVFDMIAMFRPFAFDITDGDKTVRLEGAAVSANLFNAVGVQPFLGRAFTEMDDQPGRNRVVILGYELWRSRFAGDPALLGHTIGLNGSVFTVIGIMPKAFSFPGVMFSGGKSTEIWAPLSLYELMPPRWLNRNQRVFTAVARLKQGVTVESAQSEMNLIAGRLAVSHPDTNDKWGVRIMTLQEQLVGRSRTPLLLLFAAVGLVLLIACANLATLFLARSSERQSEIALRAALGATRSQIVRQLLTENAMLAIVGGALSLLLSAWGIEMVAGSNTASIPRLMDAHLDGVTLLFTFMLSLATGLLVGLLPALRISNIDPGKTLKKASSRTATAVSSKVFRFLVSSEIALTLALFITSALMVQSFWRLMESSPGFRPESVAVLDFTLRPRYFDDGKKLAFYGQVIKNFEQIPGTKAVGAVDLLPLSGRDDLINVAAQHTRGDAMTSRLADERTVTSGYFAAMGIPVLRGRSFTEADSPLSPSVAIINGTLSKQLFGGAEAIGEEINLLAGGKVIFGPMAIVGVVEDIKNSALENAPRPQVYMHFSQNTRASMTLVIRSDRSIPQIRAEARLILNRIDPDQALTSVRSMNDVLVASSARKRWSISILTFFTCLALGLTVVGIYGIVSFTVGQRTNEIVIRLALGATHGRVVRLVLVSIGWMLLVGIAEGCAAAVALSSVLRGQLYGVSAFDPRTYLSVATFVSTVVMLTSYLAVRRFFTIANLATVKI